MQLKKVGIKGLGLVFFVIITLHCSLVYSADNLPPGTMVPGFKITGPGSPQTKAYLGVNDEKLFSLSQVKSKLTLVEFFDVFCPVCQKNAPLLNRVYNLFKDDKNLGKDIKMIGLGLGTQPEDLPAYKKAFKVEFPLFADPKKEIQKLLKVQGVPLTVLLDKNGKVLMSHPGAIGNFDGFVSEIKKNYQGR
jgi:peroxiredoxin